MKSKGFTLVEIIVSVALISIVMLLLFQLMTDIEYDSFTSSFASDNQVNRATIIKRIENDIMNNGLSSVPSISDVNNTSKEITLNFSGGNSKNIVVTSSTLTYDDESFLIDGDGTYDYKNIKVISVPNSTEKLCTYMLNVDTNNDGKCDVNCGTSESDIESSTKNDSYVYCPIYQFIKIKIPILGGEDDIAIDDIEIFYMGKLS